MEDNVRYPRFISNGPCGEDLFAGKAHQRIAEEIADQLLHPGVPHVIGLDGGWGAGKSNIIEIIRRKAQEKKKVGDVLFFTYNAWGHQGDPLRRSILEELTRCIVRSNTALTKKKKRTWKKNLNTLLSQRKEVSTKTFPKLSAGVIVFLLVIPLTPVFNAIAKALPAFLNQWTEGIVTATPILLALIYAVAKYCKFRRKKMNSRKKKKRSSFKSFLSELFYLYKGSVQETETHEEVYSSEATSTQFKDWIGKLDKALKARLVIVIDDMDRLPARNVQELWAAIHTLFTEVKYKRIKVIVPFDRSHLISAFREENIQDEDSTPKCYGNDFIDKTFDVVYRVAPPILSDWKTYLINRWNEAFGKEPEGSVTQIYDLLAKGTTPREIIAFINECVTIKRTCTSEISDEYIALFAVGKHEIVQDPQCELLELKFCRVLSYRYDNEETRKYLSAIHYQLEPDNALETIYVEQLRRELDKGESTLLQTLIMISPSIINHAIVRISSVENTAIAFSKITEIPKRLWNELVQKALKENLLPKEATQALLKNSSKTMSYLYLKHVIELLYIRSRKAEKSPAEKGFDAQWFHNGMNRLCRMVQEIGHGHLQPLSMLHTEYINVEDYINYISFTKKCDGDSEDYKIRCDTADLAQYLDQEEADIYTPNYDTEYEEPQAHSMEEDHKNKLMLLIRNAKSANEAEMLFNRWVKNFVTDYPLHSEDQIAHLLPEAPKGSLLHNCLICQLIAHGGSKSHPENNAILAEEDNALVQALSPLINRFISYERLLCMYDELGVYPLCRQLVKRFILSKEVGDRRVLEMIHIIYRYAEISDAFALPLEELLKDWSLFQFENSITPKTALYIPAQFFVDTRELGQNELVQHCRETAIQYLNTLSKEEWEIAVREKNHAYELFTALQCDPPENGKEILA